MARIQKIEPGELSSRVHPTTVICAAQIIDGGDGEVLVQLASFGSAGSQSAENRHVTQTYQFDREAARVLSSYFEVAFGRGLNDFHDWQHQ